MGRPCNNRNNNSSRYSSKYLRDKGEFKIMANHVYFTINLEGVDENDFNENVTRVKGKRLDYDGNEYEWEDYDYIENQPFMGNVTKTFDENGDLEGAYDWYCNNVGAKWCNIEEMEDCYISGYSAWRQPVELVLNLINYFSNRYDTHVSATMTYEDEFRNFMGKQYYDCDGPLTADDKYVAYEGEYYETDHTELMEEFNKRFPSIDTDSDDFDYWEEVKIGGDTILPSEVIDEIADEFWSKV